jgi:hypothetical protein
MRAAKRAREGNVGLGQRSLSFDSDGFTPAERDLRAACFGPQSGVVVLGGNDWDHCAFDSVHITGLIAEGFHNVCPGRHRIVTMPSGRRRTAVVDFVLYPGEMLAWCLDAQAARWIRCDLNVEPAVTARVGQEPLLLLDYFETVGTRRLEACIAVSRADAVRGAITALKGLVHLVDAGHEPAQLVAAVRDLTWNLMGAPVASMNELTSTIGAMASDRAAEGKLRHAWLILQLGLAILPDDPVLSTILGELFARQGQWSQARQYFRAARERPAGLDEAWRLRVLGAFNQVTGKLG